jgi:amino acid adenylation domain-containing protein
VAVETGSDAIVAILAALRAGKIFVALDPALPEARIRYILSDTRAALAITNRRNLTWAGSLGFQPDRTVLLEEPEYDGAFPPEAAPEAPAWILYTSGSTGQPKGVVQTHRNVLEYIRIYTTVLGLGPQDRLALLFSHAVNAGAHEIFSALLNGASLHFWHLRQWGVEGLGGWLAEEGITAYCSVPTVFRRFVDALEGGEEFPALRWVKLVGEPVYRNDVVRFRRHFPRSCTLINRLGMSETGTLCWHFIDHEDPVDGELTPVGRPVENHEIQLLDEAGREVPSGEVGEIVVRSPYLSPGYWNRGPAGDVLRTGDLGRLRPDGLLVHVGRKDAQVKVRGYRVELVEVEAALAEAAEVGRAVVVARPDPSGETRLVAYIVPRRWPGPAAGVLRAHLAERLPEYMIPWRFVVLEALLAAPNGKVDLRALPPPSPARPHLGTPFVTPRGDVEEKLAAIWREVLGLDAVGVADNFFELGGDSLLATQMITRTRHLLHADIPIHCVFETPTIADLARRLSATRLHG